MSRRTADVEVNTFIRGLITEASPLTYPENASLSEVNFVLNRDGSRQRRLGMDYEDAHVLQDTGIDLVSNPDIAISSHVWENANQDGSLDIGVIQVGSDIYFYDINRETISANILNGGVPISTGGSSTVEISTASIQGKLIVAHELSTALLYEYDSDTDTINTSTISISVRDQFGIGEALDAGERPNFTYGNTDWHKHRYNLLNQGWPLYADHIYDEPGDLGTRGDPVNSTQVYVGFLPSNSDIFWSFTNDATDVAQLIGMFSPWMMRRGFTGTGQAPRGRIVLDLFERGQARQVAYPAGSSSIPQDETQGVITSVESYAGRIFFTVREDSITNGDANTPKIGSMVFYSQVVSSETDLGSCYSKLDPTEEILNEVLATDGGFISIPEAGSIFKLSTLGNSLFIIADNGVWELHGGEQVFSATNQNINKITKVGAMSQSSILSSEEVLSYWAESGIQVITKDEVSLRGVSNNITYTSIQSFYEDISVDSRKKTSASYDPVSRQVRWLYGTGLGSKYFADKELVFDLSLKAFYTSNISSLATDSPYLAGYVPLSSTIYNTTASQIIVGSSDVVVGADTVVASSRTIDETTKGSTKYLALVKNSGDANWSFTFSHYKQAGFKDWVTKDSVGLDAPASVLTGFLTAGVASKDKKTPYLVTHCKLTEEGFTDGGLGNLTEIAPSSCIVQSQWEWSNSDAAGRWGPEFQAYRLPRYFGPTGAADPFDYGFTVVTTKNKLRGKGRALSILFKTEPGKDLHLYGWGHTLNIENISYFCGGICLFILSLYSIINNYARNHLLLTCLLLIYL